MTKKDKEASEINAAANGQYIVMLTEAEKKARDVIEAAKKRKAIVLKKARDDSSAEIEDFKKERELHLKQIQMEFANNKDTSAVQFQRDLDVKKTELKARYQENYEKTLEKVLECLTTVDPKFHGNLKI